MALSTECHSACMSKY